MRITEPKTVLLFTVIAALFMIAAQCGASPTPIQKNSTPAEKRTAFPEEEPEQDLESAPELAAVPLNAGEKLKVVATTSIVADIVSKVGGDMIELSLLLPIGADPHTFDPTPRDLATVADAHVIFANGFGLEAFLDEMIKNAGSEAVVVHVSHGIEARQLGKGGEHEHERNTEMEEQEHEAGQAAGHSHHLEGVDPHTWTSPANAMVFVYNIEQALSTLDPANAETYEAKAEAYEAELEELDAWVKAQIESIPAENRKLVTDHTTFGYYADRYGLEQVGAVIPAFSTAAEPSAQALAELEDTISKYQVKAIFVGNTVNPSLVERVAADTGTQLVTLYTGSLGTAGSGVEHYLDYIRYNTKAIVEALK